MDGYRRTHGQTPGQTNGQTEIPDQGLPEGLPEDLAPTILAAVAAGRKIEAIKTLRGATGLGLREARIIVEELESAYGGSDRDLPQAPGFSEEGGARSLIVIAAALIVGYLVYRYFTGA